MFEVKTSSAASTGSDPMQDWVRELRVLGYSRLSGLLTGEQHSTVRTQLSSALALESGAGTVKSPAVTQLLLRSWSSTSLIRDLFLDPRVAWIRAHFHLRSFIEHSKLLVKSARGPETPWHQDHAFFRPFDPEATMLSFWVALDDVDRSNGCLQVSPGSHRRGLLPHRDVGTSGEKEILDISVVDPERTVDLELAAGDAVVFNSLLLHRAHRNETDAPRFAFKFVCQDRERRTPGFARHRSAVDFDGPLGFINRILPCATARLRVEADELKRRGSRLRPKLRRKPA